MLQQCWKHLGLHLLSVFVASHYYGAITEQYALRRRKAYKGDGECRRSCDDVKFIDTEKLNFIISLRSRVQAFSTIVEEAAFDTGGSRMHDRLRVGITRVVDANLPIPHAQVDAAVSRAEGTHDALVLIHTHPPL